MYKNTKEGHLVGHLVGHFNNEKNAIRIGLLPLYVLKRAVLHRIHIPITHEGYCLIAL